MRAVDTNVVVRLITRDDALQVAAAERFVEKGAWVSHIVLAETAWVLKAAYDLKREEIALVIEMLLNHDHLTLHDSELVLAALGRYRNTHAVGFTDCLVLEIARRAGHTPLGTFDKVLSRMEGVEKL